MSDCCDRQTPCTDICARTWENAYYKSQKENELLLWNLAGCDTYAMGYDLDKGHNKEMARPALESVRRLALEARALRVLQTTVFERVRDIMRPFIDWVNEQHHANNFCVFDGDNPFSDRPTERTIGEEKAYREVMNKLSGVMEKIGALRIGSRSDL